MSTSTFSFCWSAFTSTISPSKSESGPDVTFTDSPSENSTCAFCAPGPAGTTGHFYIATTNGVPTSFWTDNGPLWTANILRNHGLFVQDRFQVASRLTLNYGVRFDRYHSAYPELRFGLNGNRPCVDETNCDIGPFAVSAVAPSV